ncbi:YeeE/YedE family protein [Litorisediminicola beolgyonensis]|uniref:YeeE/YedE family protein n=1 Tax=Litorisediminicola beolgyonensis TaxID=1173614 RepID=A0ABW3ZGN5_9RHOB
MDAVMTDHALMAAVGLFGGVLLGLAARIGRFCSLGAIEDVLYAGSDRRLRMWGVAIGLAVAGSFGAGALGFADLSSSIYLAQAWNPLASIVGGLLFGYGMALAGNCGYGAIARLGGGDLRSFVIVLVMGVATFVVLSGPLASLRVALFPTDLAAAGREPGLAHGLARMTGVPLAATGIAAGLLIALASAAGREIRGDAKALAWSAVVALAVVSAWVGTSAITAQSFEPLGVQSHTYSAPLGETILWFMTASGRPLSFAVGSVAGVWLGAFLGSVRLGHFRWEACEDPRELRRQIVGAALMGGGAVVAMGCTVGQGLSAFSVLAFSAPVTAAAIFAGAALGLRHLIWGFSPAE